MMDITRSIAEMRARVIVAGSPRWEPTKFKGVGVDAVVAHETPNVIGNLASPPPPPDVIAVPGVGFWRDDSVVEAARAEFAAWQAEQAAKQEKQAIPKKSPAGGKKGQRIRTTLKPRRGSYDLNE
jgi:hypothetical protein